MTLTGKIVVYALIFLAKEETSNPEYLCLEIWDAYVKRFVSVVVLTNLGSLR